MTDLLLPLIIIIVMCIIIDFLDVIYPLLMIGLMFIPISWIFGYQVQDGLYTTLFSADITEYLGNVPGIEKSLQTMMWLITILAFAKIYFVRNLIDNDE